MKTRIGPSMIEALEFIRANPGCSQNEVSNSISASGNNWQVIKRLVDANLIVREAVLTKDGFPKGYRLYVREV